MQKIKVTKKQRKAMRGMNQTVAQSMSNGDRHVIGERPYMGKNPTYRVVTHHEIDGVRIPVRPYAQQMTKGMPFVRSL